MADRDEITEKDFSLLKIALQRKNDAIVGFLKDIEEAQACCTSDEMHISKSKDRMILENIHKIMNVDCFSNCGERMCENIHGSHEKDRILIKITLEICAEYQEEEAEPHLLEQQEKYIKECVLEMMPSQVKESLENLSPAERFIWCATLLINFHFGTECSEFMSCVFKFILKVLYFKVRSSNIYRDTDAICSLFTNYVYRIQENNCSAYAIVNAIKVFYTTDDSRTIFFRNEVDMTYLLNKCQEVNFNLFRFFGSVMYMKETPLYLIDFSINLWRYDNFRTLLQFGVVDYYNSNCYKDLRE